MLSKHLYIYFISEDGGRIYYDRSMPRDCVNAADRRVEELRKRGREAFYTIGEIMLTAFV